MARKRRVGRPRVKGGPRKMTDKSAKAYMNRGLSRYLKAKGAGSKVGRRRRKGAKRGLKKGHKKSAAWKAAIGRGVKAAWKRGAYKGRKRRSARRRKGRGRKAA